MPLLGRSGADSVAVGYDGMTVTAVLLLWQIFFLTHPKDLRQPTLMIKFFMLSGNIVSFFNIYNSMMGDLGVPHHYGKNNNYWMIELWELYKFNKSLICLNTFYSSSPGVPINVQGSVHACTEYMEIPNNPITIDLLKRFVTCNNLWWASILFFLQSLQMKCHETSALKGKRHLSLFPGWCHEIKISVLINLIILLDTLLSFCRLNIWEGRNICFTQQHSENAFRIDFVADIPRT